MMLYYEHPYVSNIIGPCPPVVPGHHLPRWLSDVFEPPGKVPSYCIPKGVFHPLPGTKPKLHAPRLAGYFDFDPYPLRPGCLVTIRSWFSADGEEEGSWRVLECDGKQLLPYPTLSSRGNRVPLAVAETASLAPPRSCLYKRTARRTSAVVGASTCVETLVGSVGSHDVHGLGDVASTRPVRRGVQEVSEGQPAGRLYRARRCYRRCTLGYIRETWRYAVGSRALMCIKTLARMQRYRVVATLQARFRGRKVRSRISSVVLDTASRVRLRGSGRNSHAFDRVWARRSTPGAFVAWQAERGDALRGREGLRGRLVQSITSRQMRIRKLAEARISAWVLRVKQRRYNSIVLQCAAEGTPILARKLHAFTLRQTRSMRGSGGQQDVKFANVQFGKDAARYGTTKPARLFWRTVSRSTRKARTTLSFCGGSCGDTLAGSRCI